MPSYIVADIGGTQIRAACFRANSLTPERVERLATQSGVMPVLDRLYNLISVIWPQNDDVIGIALALPGPVDPFQGILFGAPNIPGWTNLPLRRLMVERFHVPVVVGNDANLAALGEWKFGAGRGHHHLIYVTISTGIGGGVIINDELLLGSRGLAGEIGHITVMPGGPLCGCGQRGHLEAIASGPAIARWSEEQISQGAASILSTQKRLSAKDVSRAAQQGDPLAIAALERAGTSLGVAIAGYLHIFNPTAVILGGGVTQSGDHLLLPLRKALREHIMSPTFLENLTITTAALGDDVGLMGTLALAQTLRKA